MKLLKPLTGICLLCLFIWVSSTQLSSCKKKTDIIHDTVTVYDTQDGLVAWYTFNGGSLSDGSGFNNNIVNSGATQAADRFGNANNAYSFNGTSNYMRVANSLSLNPTGGFTVMAIVKVNGFYTGQCHTSTIVDKGTPDNIQGFYAMRIWDQGNDCNAPANLNKEAFYAAYGDDNPQGAAAGAIGDTVLVKTGQWYNLIYTYDGLWSKLYINGVLKYTSQKSVPFNPNSHDVFIGRHEDGANTFPYYFNGIIDELRIYNRALPLGAVTQLNNLKQ